MADLSSEKASTEYHSENSHNEPRHAQSPTPTAIASSPVPPFSGSFFDNDNAGREARAVYLKANVMGLILVTLTIFSVLSIYWGALWQVEPHVHNLKGWVVVRLHSLSFCIWI